MVMKLLPDSFRKDRLKNARSSKRVPLRIRLRGRAKYGGACPQATVTVQDIRRSAVDEPHRGLDSHEAIHAAGRQPPADNERAELCRLVV